MHEFITYLITCSYCLGTSKTHHDVSIQLIHQYCYLFVLQDKPSLFYDTEMECYACYKV
jgi:hypothetical protein